MKKKEVFFFKNTNSEKILMCWLENKTKAIKNKSKELQEKNRESFFFSKTFSIFDKKK